MYSGMDRVRSRQNAQHINAAQPGLTDEQFEYVHTVYNTFVANPEGAKLLKFWVATKLQSVSDLGASECALREMEAERRFVADIVTDIKRYEDERDHRARNANTRPDHNARDTRSGA